MFRIRIVPAPHPRIEVWPPAPGEVWRWTFDVTHLPGANQILASKRRVWRAAADGSRFAGDGYSKIKKQTQQAVMLAARAAGLVPLVRAEFAWDWWTSSRMDPDNLTLARKFVLDALVQDGILADDSWDDVLSEPAPGRYAWLWETFSKRAPASGPSHLQDGNGVTVTIEGPIAAPGERDRRRAKFDAKVAANQRRTASRKPAFNRPGRSGKGW